MLAKTSMITGGVIGAMLFAAPAHAQSETESEAKPSVAATAAGDGASQLTLPKGRLLLNAFVGIGLSTDAVFKPISLSPDVWYGVTDDITAGLVHSALGASGFMGGVANSLCITGESNGCAELYPGFGLEARYKLKNGTMSYAASGGLYVNRIDPLLLGLKAGGILRMVIMPKLAIEAAPSLFIGITNRSQDVMGVSVTTNPDVLSLPATGLFALTPQITLAGQLGLILPLEGAGDGYAVPLSVGGHFRVNESMTATMALTLGKLLGGGSGNGIDTRSLTLGGTYAF